MTHRPCTYVFAVPRQALVKIGHSSNLPKRRYAIRWGEVRSYTPDEISYGDFICVVQFGLIEHAKAAERRCQAELALFRVRYIKPIQSTRAGGRPEWFECSHETAVSSLVKVAKAIDRGVVITNLLGAPLFDLT